MIEPTPEFWALVDRSNGPESCWPWLGGVSGCGYGYWRLQRAHRIAASSRYGVLPSDRVVAHDCDFKLCCNPAHLTLCLPAENSRQAVERGLIDSKGDRHPMARLTERDVIEIRASSLSGYALAERFGVSDSTISLIRRRKRWTHI